LKKILVWDDYDITSSKCFEVVSASGLAGPMPRKSYYVKARVQKAHAIHRDTDAQRENVLSLIDMDSTRYSQNNGHN